MIRTIILVAFALTLFMMAVRSLRAMRLKERHFLLFVAVGLPFLVLAVWPDGVVWVSRTLRIEKATVLILGLTMFVIVMLMRLLSLVSVQERKIATLTQLVGVLMEGQGHSRLPELEEPPDTADSD